MSAEGAEVTNDSTENLDQELDVNDDSRTDQSIGETGDNEKEFTDRDLNSPEGTNNESYCG